MTLDETLARIRTDPENTDVREIEARVVQPILSDLGWIWRDPVQVNFVSRAADVALSIPRGEHASLTDRSEYRAAVLIKIEPDAERMSADALVGEARRDGIELCVLAGDRRWQLYLPKPMEPAERCRFADWDLQTDPLTRLTEELETYLGRDALIQQAAQRAAEHALTSRRNAERLQAAVPQVWQRLLAGPEQLLVELVEEEVRKDTGLHPDAEHVKGVIRASADESVHTRKVSEPGPVPEFDLSPPVVSPPVKPAPVTPKTVSNQRATGREQTKLSGSGLIKRKKSSSSRIVAYRVLGAKYKFITSKRMWLDVVESVYRRHPDDFERAFQLRGTTRQYISASTSRHTSPGRIGDSSYFAETNFSSIDCERRSRDLLALFGYSRDELEIIYG